MNNETLTELLQSATELSDILIDSIPDELRKELKNLCVGRYKSRRHRVEYLFKCTPDGVMLKANIQIAYWLKFDEVLTNDRLNSILHTLKVNGLVTKVNGRKCTFQYLGELNDAAPTQHVGDVGIAVKGRKDGDK